IAKKNQQRLYSYWPSVHSLPLQKPYKNLLPPPSSAMHQPTLSLSLTHTRTQKHRRFARRNGVAAVHPPRAAESVHPVDDCRGKFHDQPPFSAFLLYESMNFL
ncbi:hypothetical protein Pfo_007356, partial [Paulownia fortunei]